MKKITAIIMVFTSFELFAQDTPCARDDFESYYLPSIIEGENYLSYVIPEDKIHEYNDSVIIEHPKVGNSCENESSCITVKDDYEMIVNRRANNYKILAMHKLVHGISKGDWKFISLSE